MPTSVPYNLLRACILSCEYTIMILSNHCQHCYDSGVVGYIYRDASKCRAIALHENL